MSRRGRPEDELYRVLAKAKAAGITVRVKPANGREQGFDDRPAGIIEAEARKLGMTYGERESGALR